VDASSPSADVVAADSTYFYLADNTSPGTEPLRTNELRGHGPAGTVMKCAK
jgi:hypothetical protein